MLASRYLIHKLHDVWSLCGGFFICALRNHFPPQSHISICPICEYNLPCSLFCEVEKSGMRMLLFLLTILAAASGESQRFAFRLSDAPVASVPSTYLSTTMDMAVFVDHDHCNLESPTLINLTSALQMSFMRVGGTQGDYTYYNLSSQTLSPGTQLPPHFRRVFSSHDWDILTSFLRRTGMSMFFGLNAGWGAGVRDERTGDWNSSAAMVVMQLAAARKDPVAGFEFSNEPNLFIFSSEMNASLADRLVPEQLAKDVVTLRQAISTFPAMNWTILCCDVAYVPLLGEIWNFTGRFSSSNGLEHVDQTTFHFYPLLSSSYNKSLPPLIDPFYASPDKVLDPLILDQVGYWADTFVIDSSHGKKGSNIPPIVLGETGSAVGGGQQGLSDAFADVIEYSDKIGQMTLRGQHRMFRQTLCGSPDQYYALINNNLAVKPSYFLTALFNQILFGGSKAPLGEKKADVYKAAPQTNSSSDVTWSTTRMYSMCTFTGDALGTIIINLNSTSPALVAVSASSSSSLQFDIHAKSKLFVLTSAGDLSSSAVLLNGIQLAVDPTKVNVIQPPFDEAARLVSAALSSSSLLVEVPALSVSLLVTPLVAGSC